MPPILFKVVQILIKVSEMLKGYSDYSEYSDYSDHSDSSDSSVQLPFSKFLLMPHVDIDEFPFVFYKL